MTAFRQVLRRHLLLVACLIGHLHPGFATALLGQTQTVTELKVVASVDPAGQLLGEIEWITRGPSGLVAVSDRGSGQVPFSFRDR